MPVEPSPDRRCARSTWARRATASTAVTALATLGAFGSAGTAHAQAPEPSTAQHASAPGEVTVRPGDTLWSIATAHGVDVLELARANRIPAHGMLRPGQHLTVPRAHATNDDAAPAPRANGTAATRPAPSAQPPAAEGAATSRGTGARAARPDAARANPAHAASAQAAQEPAQTPHTVSAGDTLWGLAERYSVSVADLLEHNDLSVTSMLRPGDTLRVPGHRGASPAAPQRPATTPATPAPAAAQEASKSAAKPAPGGHTPRAVGDTFAGRSYAQSVVDSANRHHAELQRREIPSPERIRAMVAETARAMGVDPALALAHASQESGFQHGVVSPADAVGTMQVIPAAGEWASSMVGRDLDVLDPQDNITAGVAIIKRLQQDAPDKRTGIAGYYQGLHGVKTYGMYPDTKAYVRAVTAQEQRFAH